MWLTSEEPQLGRFVAHHEELKKLERTSPSMFNLKAAGLAVVLTKDKRREAKTLLYIH